MGTRHLIAVKLDDEYKIAQYGQWDGYPEGHGVTVLRFCKELQKYNYKKNFCSKVRALSWYTDDELDRITNNCFKAEKSLPPEISRDTGGDILSLVAESPPGMKLKNSISFAADGMFCEYAYVIDFDDNTLECYRGFSQTPLTEGDRFYFLKDYECDGCNGVKLVVKWNLDHLPSEEEFCEAVDLCSVD